MYGTGLKPVKRTGPTVLALEFLHLLLQECHSERSLRREESQRWMHTDQRCAQEHDRRRQASEIRARVHTTDRYAGVSLGFLSSFGMTFSGNAECRNSSDKLEMAAPLSHAARQSQ